MKKYLRLPTQRTRLKLSAVFFALALTFLWLTAEAPMPLPILSHYKAAAEFGIDIGGVVADGTVHFESGAAETEGGDEGLRWLVSRCEDGYFVTTHRRVGGVLWNAQQPYRFWPSEEDPIRIAELGWGFDVTEPFIAGMGGRWQYETVTLLYVKVPNVARVVLFQGMYPREDNEGLSQYDWLLTYGSSTDCTEVAPDTSLWLGQQTYPSPSGGGSATLVRAYGADGTLLYESPVPGSPGFDE